MVVSVVSLHRERRKELTDSHQVDSLNCRAALAMAQSDATESLGSLTC